MLKSGILTRNPDTKKYSVAWESDVRWFPLRAVFAKSDSLAYRMLSVGDHVRV